MVIDAIINLNYWVKASSLLASTIQLELKNDK
jgi:hypothetical protein